MKMTKKKVFLIALAVCALAILSMGTLAWFNAADEVTNKFMVADSNGDGMPDFSVEVWENEIDGDDTADADGDGDPKITTTGNTYEKIAPGDVLPKNATVENTGDYDQWIRVFVTFDEYETIKAAYARHGKGDADLYQWLNVDSTYWELDVFDVANNEEGDTTVFDQITYCYYLKPVLKQADGTDYTGADTATLFTTISIPEWFEQEDMFYDNTDSGFNVTVLAQAIQYENTEDTAKASFEAYWAY